VSYVSFCFYNYTIFHPKRKIWKNWLRVVNVPSTPPGGSQPLGTNIGVGLAGLVSAGNILQQLNILLSFRSDPVAYKQDRCQLNAGIADEFAYQLVLHSHTLQAVVLDLSFFYFFPA
jgi:hypothetical protein